ncbi:MAG: hypothetical protein HOK52_00910 [Candidatus Marinimicrobia bacterium]|jgi:pyruvate dehydrogenase E1 component alpha subunit|nr:hypothetical protein [Candidatus Neomarinimicrobiota bacterium]
MKIPIDKRKHDFNVPADLDKVYSSNFLLNIFENMARVRYFELGVIDAVNSKKINYPVYLSSGQEAVAAVLSTKMRHYLTFPQHRAHDIYLSWGGSPEKLRDELLGLPNGTSEGKAGSNCLQLHQDNMNIYGHHGLIGENVPQAVGAALGSSKPTVCIFGDGAVEEDYVLAAMGFAASQKLPIIFICIDNNLSILTPVEVRRTWKVVDIARGFGLNAYECADDPRAIAHYLSSAPDDKPLLINIHVCREYWHAGVGVDGVPAWDRFNMIRNELVDLGIEKEAKKIEKNAQLEMEEVWNKPLLLKQLGS